MAQNTGNPNSDDPSKKPSSSIPLYLFEKPAQNIFTKTQEKKQSIFDDNTEKNANAFKKDKSQQPKEKNIQAPRSAFKKVDTSTLSNPFSTSANPFASFKSTLDPSNPFGLTKQATDQPFMRMLLTPKQGQSMGVAPTPQLPKQQRPLNNPFSSAIPQIPPETAPKVKEQIKPQIKQEEKSEEKHQKILQPKKQPQKQAKQQVKPQGKAKKSAKVQVKPEVKPTAQPQIKSQPKPQSKPQEPSNPQPQPPKPQPQQQPQNQPRQYDQHESLFDSGTPSPYIPDSQRQNSEPSILSFGRRLPPPEQPQQPQAPPDPSYIKIDPYVEQPQPPKQSPSLTKLKQKLYQMQVIKINPDSSSQDYAVQIKYLTLKLKNMQIKRKQLNRSRLVEQFQFKQHKLMLKGLKQATISQRKWVASFKSQFPQIALKNNSLKTIAAVEQLQLHLFDMKQHKQQLIQDVSRAQRERDLLSNEVMQKTEALINKSIKDKKDKLDEIRHNYRQLFESSKKLRMKFEREPASSVACPFPESKILIDVEETDKPKEDKSSYFLITLFSLFCLFSVLIIWLVI